MHREIERNPAVEEVVIGLAKIRCDLLLSILLCLWHSLETVSDMLKLGYSLDKRLYDGIYTNIEEEIADNPDSEYE